MIVKLFTRALLSITSWDTISATLSLPSLSRMAWTSRRCLACWATSPLIFTLDTYAHVTTSAQKEAAQTMGNVLSM